MRRSIRWIALCGLLGCAPDAETVGVEPGTDVQTPTATDGTDEVDDIVPPAVCEAPDPCLFDGTNPFPVDGDQRQIEVRLPADPIGAPVVFVWHYLGGSPNEMIAGMELQALADDGYLLVAPASRGLPFTEWKVDGNPESNPDIALFDALREQLTAQYAVDTERVYATGFSAGGLFTTYLTMNRAASLAATAPYSGGAPSYSYETPATDLPVLVAWGGPGDKLLGFDFADASENFAAELVVDGHSVVTCEHAMGHALPPAAGPQVHAFFDDHGGDQARPWSEEPDRVPAGCTLLAR